MAYRDKLGCIIPTPYEHQCPRHLPYQSSRAHEPIYTLHYNTKPHNRPAKKRSLPAPTPSKIVKLSESAPQYAHPSSNSLQSIQYLAHREEILRQSLFTFRAVLKDANFGEMYVGNYRPEQIDQLFISVQTLNAQDFTCRTASDYYDYIIVDEFHHAAAPSYRKLLSYYQPQILLGLTATPERLDSKSILPFFSNRIAAEIRLPEAIDRKLLCPFQYFGVTDIVALDQLRWSVGGYDRHELSNLYTLSGRIAERRADLVLASLNDYSINERLFHWQSQSTTADNSATGQRYIHHAQRGSRVLLFVREFKQDSRTGATTAYTFLGTARYVKHTGSRPMNITWSLDEPIPARFLKKTNKLVVG